MYSPGMALSPVSMLRLALPGAPTLREFAERIDCSHAAIGFFEQGLKMLSPLKLRAYAKEVHRKPSEVKKRFLLAAVAYHDAQLRELRREMRSRGIANSRGRKLAQAG